MGAIAKKNNDSIQNERLVKKVTKSTHIFDPSKVIKTHPRMVREDFKNPPPLMDTVLTK